MVLALAATTCAPAPPPSAKEKAIRIGISLCTTGPIATAGEPISWGTLTYIKYLNEELGGIEYQTADGKTERVKLDAIWEDNAYNVAKTVSIYKRQKTAGVLAMALFGSTPPI